MRCNNGNQDRHAGPGSDISVSIKSLTVTALVELDLKMFPYDDEFY